MICHRLGNKGGDKGPRLEWMGMRHDAEWIAAYLAAPPESAEMDSFDHLSAAQRLMIGDFLVSLAAQSPTGKFWQEEHMEVTR